MDKISELKHCVDTVALDACRFFKKNNRRAGVRARKKLQKCKKLAQEIRLMIQRAKQEEVQKKAEVASAHAAETGSGHLSKEVLTKNIDFTPFSHLENHSMSNNEYVYHSKNNEIGGTMQTDKNSMLNAEFNFGNLGFLNTFNN